VAVLVSVDEYRRLCSSGKSHKASLAAASFEAVVIPRARDAGRPAGTFVRNIFEAEI